MCLQVSCARTIINIKRDLFLANYFIRFQNSELSIFKKMSYSSVKPLASWIDNLIKRIDFIGRWVDMVKAKEKTLSRQQSRASSSQFSVPSDSPRCFWLPAFYFPQGNKDRNYVHVCDSVL